MPQIHQISPWNHCHFAYHPKHDPITWVQVTQVILTRDSPFINLIYSLADLLWISCWINNIDRQTNIGLNRAKRLGPCYILEVIQLHTWWIKDYYSLQVHDQSIYLGWVLCHSGLYFSVDTVLSTPGPCLSTNSHLLCMPLEHVFTPLVTGVYHLKMFASKHT